VNRLLILLFVSDHMIAILCQWMDIRLIGMRMNDIRKQTIENSEDDMRESKRELGFAISPRIYICTGL